MWVMAAQIFGVLIALAADSPLFKILPEAEQGTLRAALALQAILLILTDLGLGLTTIRVGAQYFAQGDLAPANAVFRRALLFRLVLALGVGGVTAALSDILARCPLNSPGQLHLIWAVALSLVGTGAVAWGADVSQARRRFKIYFIQQSAAAVLRTAALVSILLAVQGHASAEILLWGIAGASLLAGGLSLLLQRDALASPRPLSVLEREVLNGQLASFGRSASVMVLLNGIGASVEVFILQNTRSPAETAVFEGGRRLAMILPLLTTALTTVLLPRAAALVTVDQCRDYVLKTLRYAVPLALLAAGGLALMSGWIVPLLWGDKYTDSIPILRWLCLAHLFALALNPLTVILYPLQREGTVALLCAVSLALSIGLGLWLIPVAGPLGAAWSTLGVKAISTLLYTVLLFRLLRVRPLGTGILK